eukprot:gene9580-12290_t
MPTSATPTYTPTASPTVRIQITVSGTTLSSSNIAIISSVLLFLFLVFVFYVLWWKFLSVEAKRNRHRERRLVELPVHRALLRMQLSNHDLKRLVDTNLASALEADFDGRTAIDIILQGLHRHTVEPDVIATLLEASLPPLHECANRSVSNEHLHYHGKSLAWSLAVQHESPQVEQAVERILEIRKRHVHMLAYATDDRGRACKDVAQPRIKASILRRLNLHGRYELRTGPPVHKSQTSLVVMARDHGDRLADLHVVHNEE